ncbi:hypothetical protein FGG08_003274 [Glutinoglossum americanum]|uniref:Uncharacterized protein n=1 Tax=Glutinoglossum americanum TaxID=1670608 RepID=A0A9P8I334_9PEZI|nr:hypothetical protein FGG08_003274 [Glutinoglossum americanum]
MVEIRPDEGMAVMAAVAPDPPSEGIAGGSATASLSAGESGSEWQGEERKSKRRLFRFSKKKGDDKTKKKLESPPVPAAAALPANMSSITTEAPVVPILSTDADQISTSPIYSGHHPSSPNRKFHPPSPRLPSPASSQIFERNVQENALPAPTSPAIPSHIQTENHIPPVLEASLLAITDGHLDPDDVEIVMHTAHQPAAVTVTGIGNSEAVGNSWLDDTIAHLDSDDAASNYGTLDAADIRRLSFISFADVVQAEHVEQSNGRDSVHLPGIPSSPGSTWANRSPSPVRSLLSSNAFGTSPPTSGAGSLLGLDGSPGHGGKAPNSPTAPYSPPMGGELTIETMRQALRKTGSGDLSGARNQPLSAVSGEDGVSDRPWR